MVLVVPAFTTIKSGTDATSAAYTIKGVLDTARTYAKANNTYVWVGFYEEDVSTRQRVHRDAGKRQNCDVDRRVKGWNEVYTSVADLRWNGSCGTQTDTGKETGETR